MTKLVEKTRLGRNAYRQIRYFFKNNERIIKVEIKPKNR